MPSGEDTPYGTIASVDGPGRAWVDAVARLGGDPVAADVDARELLARYAAPDRRYHDTAHVTQVVRDADRLSAALGLDARDRAVVALAACAHDVVYERRAGADEQASAEWAAGRLAAAGVEQGDVRRVVDLVLATADHHARPGDLLAAALMDADLAVLGSDEEGYAAYVAAVREEYAALDDDAWRVGRAAVLRSLLGQQPLYRCEPAHRLWEAAARENLQRELADLEAGGFGAAARVGPRRQRDRTADLEENL